MLTRCTENCPYLAPDSKIVMRNGHIEMCAFCTIPATPVGEPRIRYFDNTMRAWRLKEPDRQHIPLKVDDGGNLLRCPECFARFGECGHELPRQKMWITRFLKAVIKKVGIT